MKSNESRKVKLHHDAVVALAGRCGVSFSYMRQVLGKRKPSPSLAKKIETESRGLIKKEVLLPDYPWFLNGE